MITPSSTFYLLLRNYNPLNETVSPDIKKIFNSYDQLTLSHFKDHWEARNSNAPVKELGKFFAKLDKELKNVSDPQIIEGWRWFYNSQPPKIKAETKKLLPEPTFLGKSLPAAKAVSPGNIMSGPVTPPVNLPNSKIPTNLIDTGVPLPSYITSNLAGASTILGKLYNNNITSIIDTLSVSSKNHASNLVPDSKHLERMSKVITPYLNKVLDSVGDAKGFLVKAMNFNPFGSTNNDISSSPLVLKRKVEGKEIAVNSSGQDIMAKTPVTNKDFASPKQTNLV